MGIGGLQPGLITYIVAFLEHFPGGFGCCVAGMTSVGSAGGMGGRAA